MAKRSNVHVVPHNGGWAVKQEGRDDLLSTHNTRGEAISSAGEVAMDEEISLFIHKQDGEFDEVLRPEQIRGRHEASAQGDGLRRGGRADDEATTTTAAPRPTPADDADAATLRPRDLFSTGSRVSWSAVLSGLVLTLAIYAALSVLGVAIGLSIDSEVSPGRLAVGGAIWAVVTLLVSLFLGGFVTSRTTVGENPGEAITYGLILWGALLVLLLHLTTVGLDVGFGRMLRYTTGADRPTDLAAADGRVVSLQPPTAFSPEVSGALGLEDPGAGTDKAPAEPAEPPARTDRESRRAVAAWWTFLAIILSMAAAVAGAVVGRGPELVLRGLRERGLLAVEPARA